MGDTLTKASTLWDNASVYAEQMIAQWAQNEALLSNRHLTPRKPGRSSIFVPKIAGYHRRKLADFVGQFIGDTPVTIKSTLSSDPIGAKIKQKVHNHYLETELDYEGLLYDAAYCALAYNYAPAVLDWIEETVEEEIEQTSMNAETGVVESVKVKQETVVASYPTATAIPPEDIRIDQSVAWNRIDDARYFAYRIYESSAYVHERIESGEWARVDLENYSEPTPVQNTTLKAERTAQLSPFMTDIDEDNDLIEIRYHYYFEKQEDGDYIPVRAVTLGDKEVLEEAKPLSIRWGGNKHAWPVVVGQVYAKPFEQYSAGLPEMAKDLQTEINAIRNQRRDNVALILNPEKYVTPFAGISPEQLAFSYPGKVVTVDNLNAIQWQSVPDATATGHNEEQRAEADLDRLFSEGPMRMGQEGRRKESATAIQQMSSNSSAATGLDTTVFALSFVKPLNEKLGEAIAQKAPEAFFIRAADELGVDPNHMDPTLAATQGVFKYNVYASAAMNDLQNKLSLNSNIMGMIQTTYGPNANYRPFVADVVELAGYDPDEIIPNPMVQGLPDVAQQDPGGVEPGGKPSIMPRMQFMGGGGMPQGSGEQ